MKYFEYQLLELFDDKKFLDEEILAADYSYYFLDGFTLTLYISPYEDYACVTLFHKKCETFLFDLGIENLDKIECRENKLFFYKYDELEPFLTVQVKPTVSFTHRL